MINKETVRTSLLKVPDFTNLRLKEIKDRLEHVTSLMEKIDPPPEAGVFLLIVKPSGKPDIWWALEDDINIGRGEDVELPLRDSKVSRLHCRLEKDGEDWVVLDQGSSNGCQVNGEIVDRRILCDGDMLQVGRYELIFVKHQLNKTE